MIYCQSGGEGLMPPASLYTFFKSVPIIGPRLIDSCGPFLSTDKGGGGALRGDRKVLLMERTIEI